MTVDPIGVLCAPWFLDFFGVMYLEEVAWELVQ